MAERRTADNVCKQERCLASSAIVRCAALSHADWQLVPTPCVWLSRALPPVAARSRAEAGKLVRRLLPRERGAPLCSLPASLCAAVLVHVM